MKTLRAFAAAAAISAAPLFAGAPWISVESPANPMNPATRGAFAVVHTWRHAEPMPFVVTGTAEGLVRGERRTAPLTLRATGQIGSMALMKSWADDGVWVLRLRVDGLELSAAIGVGADGDLAFIRVPTTRQGGPRNITDAEVESLLRALAAGERVPALAAR